MESVERAVILKAELDSQRPISREQELRIMQKFRLDWNYHSNRIEGNSLTYGETKALIMFGLTAQGKPLKDHIEIEGHNEAIEWILDIVKGDYPLTESFVREIHTLLLKESYTVDAITAEGLPTKKRVEIGRYKSQPNHVLTNTGEIFRFATPEETPALMGELVDWYRERMASVNVNPILLAAEFHYKFICIHPFDDGNGRTARILMNFILMQFNYPPVIIKNEEKQQYFAALRQADSGIFEPFLNFIATNLVQSLELMIKGANGERIEDPDDFDKELALLEKKLESRVQTYGKTVDLVQDLYDKSFIPLFKLFLEENGKFERFYQTSDIVLNIDNFAPILTKESIWPAILSVKIGLKTTEIRLNYNFKSFKFSELDNFGFASSIFIRLLENSYVVSCKPHLGSVTKVYGEYLNQQEILNFVKSEAQWHKEHIERKTKI